MEKVALPTQRIKAEQINPKRLVIYSKHTFKKKKVNGAKSTRLNFMVFDK